MRKRFIWSVGKLRNPKVVVMSLIALGFMVLTFTVHWSLIIGAAVLSWMGWKELLKK